MGTKFNEEKGYWEAYWSQRHPITREPKSLRRRHLRSEADAKRTERELMRLIEQAFNEDVVPRWPKVVNEYLESKRLYDWTEKTLQNARLCLGAHTLEQWKCKRVSEISPKDIKELLNAKVGGRSPSSQQTLLKFIRGAFQYAVEAGYITSNPAPNVRWRISQKIQMVLTEPQVRQLLDKAKEYNSEWYHHWALALYTGMRNGELFALTWDRVNMDARTILVNSSWNKVDGFKDTKSGNDRIVEIAPNLQVILAELKLAQFDSHFVLPRSRNWEKGEQARMLRMFLQGIGLPSIRFHDLRATWATIMLTKGVEPIKVMSMGGWTQLKTMQIYIRKAGVDIKGITDELDLHNPCQRVAGVLDFTRSSES
ncbi:MAG: tyrosine-type recombinase/integrase [Bdellovibrionales bacterium]